MFDIGPTAVELLLHYPQEYIFIPRGQNTIRMPPNFFPPRFADRANEIDHEYVRRHLHPETVNNQIINIENIEEPDMDFIANYGRKAPFCLFNPNDRAVSTQLITKLMEIQNRRDFLAYAVYIRDRINPYLFQYAYSVAVQHKHNSFNDHVRVPSVITQFPNNFIEPSILEDAKEETRILPQNRKAKKPFEVPANYTAADHEEEQRMAYFREDIGVNMHHWHWHLVYPNSGPIEIVGKDRRGELFMYMHNQIVARYNLDRFCNDLGRTIPLTNLRDPIPEGYYPKLLETVSKRTYPSRMPGQKLHDMNRPDLIVGVADLERWADRILGSIDRGYIFDSTGKRVDLDGKHGIDILGNLIESSALSVNPQFYGNLHNIGHLIISHIHDPDAKYLEGYSVMGDTTTAMRDPVFYRWHAYIDSFGAKHKALLPPYSADELRNDRISVESFEAKCLPEGSKQNVMQTFWQQSDVDIGVGLDLNERDGLATFRFTHLAHEPFIYKIIVHNARPELTKATCRIFLLPRDDERMVGLTLEEQRLLAVEMDRFSVNLRQGENTINRRSINSSVTTPFTNIFKSQVDKRKVPMDQCIEELCACGWPNHMLLPKGTPAGKLFKLFVMISDDYDDRMLHHFSPFIQERMNPISFCGLKNHPYPDTRTMGFPFDRRLPALRLDKLLEQFSNMKSCDLSIAFRENIPKIEL